MRYSRLFILFLLIAAVTVMGAGCGKKVYFYNFATAGSTGDWNLDPFGGTYQVIPGTGLEMDGYGVSSPFAFIGDFTMSVVFTLDVSVDEQVYFDFYSGDSKYWEPDNYIYSLFEYIGWLTEEEWYVEDVGPANTGYIVNSLGSIPTLNRTGDNTWTLVKNGNSYETFINSFKVSDFNSTYCRGSKYYLSFSSMLDGGNIYFKSVEVEYSGSMVN